MNTRATPGCSLVFGIKIIACWAEKSKCFSARMREMCFGHNVWCCRREQMCHSWIVVNTSTTQGERSCLTSHVECCLRYNSPLILEFWWTGKCTWQNSIQPLRISKTFTVSIIIQMLLWLIKWDLGVFWNTILPFYEINRVKKISYGLENNWFC